MDPKRLIRGDFQSGFRARFASWPESRQGSKSNDPSTCRPMKSKPFRPVISNNGYSPMRMVLDIFAQIFRTLWAHKLRSFLTMFGIAWGVGSLLLLVGLGEGFRSGNKRELAQYGKDIMFIYPGRAPVVQGSMSSARRYLLTYQDYADIR